MRIKTHKKFVSRGFTLIELLVVIAIIGILSSVVLASLNTARTKGQDAARISSVKSLKTALELYYSTYGTYPQSPVGNGDVILNDATLNTALVPTYIGSMPAILVADGDHYYGVGNSGGTSQYGLYIYTTASGWCKTGVSTGNMATNGWWGSPPVCNF
jgi:prepilin-type N-terminal cleavage/methylation domain-containing protein